MRIQRLVSVIGLATLLIIPLTACRSTPKLMHLTEPQVISIVQVYGVPTIKVFGEPVQPLGRWAAVHEGGGKWRIAGFVVARFKDGVYPCETLWLYEPPNLQLIALDVPSLPKPKMNTLSYEEFLEYIHGTTEAP